jgi:hypothetical protein
LLQQIGGRDAGDTATDNGDIQIRVSHINVHCNDPVLTTLQWQG